MSLPKQKEYYHAAQFRSIVCWCRLDYVAKWKDMEKEFGGCPIQSIIRDKEIYKKKKKTTVRNRPNYFIHSGSVVQSRPKIQDNGCKSIKMAGI